MLMTTEWSKQAAEPEELLRWYIVRTAVSAEWQVYHGLLKRGISSFFPHYIASIRRHDWFRGEVKALFPGYLLAGLEPGQTNDDVRKVGGAQGILRIGPSMIEMTPAQVEHIREQAAGEYVESWGKKARVIRVNVGDWVPLPAGKLPGLDGTPVQIEAIDKRGQITASIGPGTIHFALSDLTEGSGRPLKAIRQG